jgi:hypothetical protein
MANRKRAEKVRARRGRSRTEEAHEDEDDYGDAEESEAAEDEDEGGDYEFAWLHDQVITNVATKMRFVAGAGFVVSVIGALMGALQLFGAARGSVAIGGMISLAVWLVGLAVATWTYNASLSFRAIAETKGDDVGHLMAALQALDKVYLVQCIFVVLTLVALCAAFLLGLSMLA